MECIPGLLPSFVEAYRQELLTAKTKLTESQMFELVLKHFDLNCLFEAILLCQYGTPFLHKKPLSILTYQRTLEDHTLRTYKYFLSIAVPIYRDRYLIVKSKKLVPILEEATKENSAATRHSLKECGVKAEEPSPKEDFGVSLEEGDVQDEQPSPKEDSVFSFEEGGPILEQVVFSIPESAPHPIPLITPSNAFLPLLK